MKVETKFGESIVTIESGKLAKQANGSAVVIMGETIVFAAAEASHEKREGIDFLPLTVDYQERYYGVGRIPGNFFRREQGRPSEKETLTARFIDRPCRPLISKDWTYETQVIAQAWSVDNNYDPDLLAMLAASTALTLSEIPFEGPIAGSRVCRVDGKLVVGPTQSQINQADMTLIVAASETAVVMVEGGGREVEEAEILDAIFMAKEAVAPLLKLQLDLQRELGKPKRPFEEIKRNEELINQIKKEYYSEMLQALTIKTKMERHRQVTELKDKVLALSLETNPEGATDVVYALNKLEGETLRNLILDEGRRIDG
ncbi:MAG: polyribonucleotide nucleotidyltransferase, partial [Deltaproteobacteria bacterium]|nr:polyribonucleotide nucleotidyltransferase [Deltaproteobacteria bacterium]